MLPSVKNAGSTKAKVLSKREVKKRINIPWNSGIFFQLGLAAVLLLTFIAMESDWDLGGEVMFVPKKQMTIEEPTFFKFQLEQPEVKTVAKVQKTAKPRVVQPVITSTFTAVENNSPKTEIEIKSTEVTPTVPTTSTGTKPVIKKEGPSHINTVQFVPVFPGCESLSNNAERRACMSSKVNAFISRRFNADKFSNLESGKLHTVRVQFTIGKDGRVKDILARAELPELEKEAKRVIGRMPIMTPGKQGNTEVDVLFMVPIRFQVQ
ncbi:MAG: energy transducer TonB [Bacteroidota bacterium]